VADEVDQQRLAERLLAQAREQGVDLVGQNGLLNQLTKTVLETALEAEMTEHLGYAKHDPVGRTGGNSRNGIRSKTVLPTSPTWAATGAIRCSTLCGRARSQGQGAAHSATVAALHAYLADPRRSARCRRR
jgi:hypothetical protein